MSESEYELLVQNCDALLLAPDATFERTAIPWLHVIREHPVFLSNYLDLFDKSENDKAVNRTIGNSFQEYSGRLKKIMAVLRSGGKPWYGSRELPREVDFLFVSHLLNESQAGSLDDFYFGRVGDELVDRGYSVVIALINHSGGDAPSLAARWRGGRVPRVILSDSIPLPKVFTINLRLMRESLRMRAQARKANPGLAKSVLIRASQEALSGGAHSFLRMASQIGSLTSMLQPRAIVLTHEGHAWERVVFAAARRACKDLRCVGYQHAALFKLQHAIRRKLGPQYNPDRIVTAGSVTQAQLEREPRLKGIPVTVMGSNRGSIGELEKTPTTDHKQEESLENVPSCLVIPEGIKVECETMFSFALACARLLPRIRFILRLHPIISFESLASKNPEYKRLPENVEVSSQSLNHDLMRCRWSLYRGTTAVVQSVLAGLRPVYLKRPNELSIDPLYELNTFRVVVESPDDFIRVVSEVNGGRNLEDRGFEEARDYCRRYFMPWDVGVLEKVV